MSFAQNWQGSYCYDAAYALTFPPSKRVITFVLNCHLGWFGKLRGTVKDGPNGVPETAKLNGRLSGNKLRFTKIYPRTWGFFAESKASQVFDNRPASVFYSGELSEDNRSLRGNWEIRPQRRRIDNAVYELPRLTGTWEAEAVAKPRC